VVSLESALGKFQRGDGLTALEVREALLHAGAACMLGVHYLQDGDGDNLPPAS
jgi:hypothetical protein